MHNKIFLRLVAVTTLLAFFSACASSTVIESKPSGAKVFLNGEPAGKTPYTMTDTKFVGSSTTVRLEMEGYEPYTAVISRTEELDVGPLIAGICLGPVTFLVGFAFLFWVMKYKPNHLYELQPRGGGSSTM